MAASSRLEGRVATIVVSNPNRSARRPAARNDRVCSTPTAANRRPRVAAEVSKRWANQ